MLVLHDPDTLLHKSKEILGSRLIDALECPERIEAIVKSMQEDDKHELVVLEKEGDSEMEKRVRELLESSLAETHDSGYLDHLQTIFERQLENGMVEEDGCVLPECFRMPRGATGSLRDEAPRDVFARAGYYAFDMSSGISKESYTSIIASASLAILGSIKMIESQNSVTSLCRPPGHHCDTKMAGGYCYINNAVIAIEAITRLHRPNPPLNGNSVQHDTKIAVLDIDFHHGNGTQDFFYESKDILYVSIHGENEYPYYSGHTQEIGKGEGQGFNKNHPLPTNSTAEDYLRTLKDAIEEIKDFGASYLVISLGFDTYHLDPLGNFKLETGDYQRIANHIRRELRMPCLILLEGGYVIKDLGGNLVAFLDGWEDAERYGSES
ncbi:hypothetical protein E6O75_ATG10199 [Venturia nashicola]|uniref:Histone deacetylase domain-containing protein n=1 Tax=Venturia nashicola TaxID=86259 RepID=A0A4Z1NC01_9PEZI|nr:hypothetical protein E6O75_ATG10199 [Venturia nashicola]